MPVVGPEGLTPSVPAFTPGQRWISVSEPELGLGEVRVVSVRAVTISFGATAETRQYVANDDAPLRRAAFRPGDTITLKQGGTRRVESSVERGGLLYYALRRP